MVRNVLAGSILYQMNDDADAKSLQRFNDASPGDNVLSIAMLAGTAFTADAELKS